MREQPPKPEAIDDLPNLDELLEQAASEIDRSLIRLALERSPLERLRAGIAPMKLMHRFHRAAPEGR